MSKMIRDVKDILESVRALRREWTKEENEIIFEKGCNTPKSLSLNQCCGDLSEIENDLEYLAR